MKNEEITNVIISKLKILLPLNNFLRIASTSIFIKKTVIVKNKFIRVLLIISGILSLVLGIIGIFLPVMPTTPFLILSASCFIRSSETLYNKLMNNRIFGEYLRNYYQNKTLPKRVKVIAISVLWISILTSSVLMWKLWLFLLLITIASFVTYHIAKLKSKK